MTTQLDETLLEPQTEEGVETKKMASGLHSVISGRVFRHLSNFIEDRKLGYVMESSATYDFKDGLPKRQPDVSFASLAKMPTPIDEDLTFAPDLAVEVVSKNDKISEVENKIKQYQSAGVRIIWIVYPFSQKVEIYRLATGLIEEVVSSNGELHGEEVLPGFKLAVKALFE